LRPIRTAAVFAVLLLASAVAAPSVGAFNQKINTGSTGFYTILDDAGSPGTVCRYENNPGKLKDETNKVSSRQMWTHGPWAEKSWVGHQIIVFERKGAAHPWKSVWKSRVAKKRASDGVVAFFGAKHYRTPEMHNKRYRVVVQLTYYAQGSKTTLAGRVRGSLEVTRHAMTGHAPYLRGAEGGPMGWCKKRFWPVP